MLVMQRECDKKQVCEQGLLFLAWGLFLIALVLPCLYSPPVLVEGSGGNVPGVVLLVLTPLLAPVGVWFVIIDPEPSSALLAIQLIIHTVGNLLLLLSSLNIVFCVKRPRGKAIYGATVSVCTVSALSLLRSHDYLGMRLLPGYYAWCVSHVVFLSATLLTVLKSRMLPVA